ncbi:protein of unknown function [Magnetospirillum sp. XM-1]|nr:protein of unknown function [Magnetospirillum sp. XM-1]
MQTFPPPDLPFFDTHDFNRFAPNRRSALKSSGGQRISRQGVFVAIELLGGYRWLF